MSEPITPEAAMAALLDAASDNRLSTLQRVTNVRAAAEAYGDARVVAELRVLEAESPCDGHEHVQARIAELGG